MKHKAYILSSLLFLALLPMVSQGSTASALVEYKQQIEKQRLWLDREWLNLLHYYQDRSADSGYSSDVDDVRFFNATQGDENPRAEMMATLHAFFRTDIQGDAHAQCRFVSRLHWLRDKLSIDKSMLPRIQCPLYEEWHRMIQASRATLVFPAYHLNSPSSMFGHTLLRLDPPEELESSKWLSYAVNFGADVAATDDSISYAFKGLTGGYPGIFIVTPYFKKIQEYNRIEKRDIWEYRLDLTPEEVERMVTHLWELKEINFDYFFFDENCSFRLLELLEVARPGLELTDEFVLTAIPVDTVKAVERAGLIESSTFRSSQLTQLQELISLLNDEDYTFVEQILVDVAVVDGEDFSQLSVERQRRIVDVAYRYQRYQQANKGRTTEAAQQSYQLLEILNRYPVDRSLPDVEIPSPPEKGHHSRRVSLAVGEQDDKEYAELGFRMAFHSLEDYEAGFLRGAQINMFNAQARWEKETDRLVLDRLDVIDIFSITPRTRLFTPLSWRVYTGLERLQYAEDDSVALHVTGGGGVAYPLREDGVVYTLATLRLEHNNDLSDHVLEPALGLNSGVLWHWGKMTAHIEFTAEKFANGEYRSSVEYGHNFVLSRHQAIKLDLRRENFSGDFHSEVSLAFRHHF